MGSKDEAEHTTRLLDARIDGLEKQVAFLLRVNGLDLSHFRTVKDDELLGLYQDAVLVVPGWENSTGTKKEIEVAINLGIPVFYTLEELIRFLRKK